MLLHWATVTTVTNGFISMTFIYIYKYCSSLLVGINIYKCKMFCGSMTYCQYRVKAHTDRTRFGNATRIFSFQWHLTLIFFNVFSNILNHLSNFSYLVCIYLVKFLSVDGFICFWKLKIRVPLPNRVRSVCMGLLRTSKKNSRFLISARIRK
jgi:hypothetical protein